MYGLTTIHKINREAEEAHRIIASRNLQAPALQPVTPTQRADTQATISRILGGSKG